MRSDGPRLDAGRLFRPFAGFAGSWSGSGTVAFSNGTTERLRCQAGYAVASAGTSLRQNLRCASDSYTFELRTDITAEGGRVAGLRAESSATCKGASPAGSGRTIAIDPAWVILNYAA